MYVRTYFTKTDVLHFKEDFFVSKRRLKYLIHSFSAYFALSHNTNSISFSLNPFVSQSSVGCPSGASKLENPLPRPQGSGTS